MKDELKIKWKVEGKERFQILLEQKREMGEADGWQLIVPADFGTGTVRNCQGNPRECS